MAAAGQMREPTYFVLASLLAGPLHGYAITKRAEDLSGGRISLAAGTLYGALDRLAGRGLVTSAGEEVVNGRTRRYYRLTDEGHAAVAAEARRLEASARVVVEQLRGSPSVGLA